MQQWVIPQGNDELDGLALRDVASPEPGPDEVVIRVAACSINYRDQAIVTGNYFGGKVDRDQVPLSDGVGTIAAVGRDVTAFSVGDRVSSTFFLNWKDGPPNPAAGPATGAPPAPGLMAQEVALPAASVIPMASSLTFDEAACLPCAGVTAWHALMEGPNKAGPERSVLVLGTGGVSLLALQIAKAAGATVIATSSSDEKLERVRALGADHTINYRTEPEWGAKAAELAGGGVDHVVEVGGTGTLQQSIAAVGFSGEIALIGVLAQGGDTSPHGLMMKGASIRGIFVGSHRMARDLNSFIDEHAIKPVIDRAFPLDEAIDAYRYQASPDLFGKVVIRPGE